MNRNISRAICEGVYCGRNLERFGITYYLSLQGKSVRTSHSKDNNLQGLISLERPKELTFPYLQNFLSTLFMQKSLSLDLKHQSIKAVNTT
jgi:hypothetical protein